MDHGYGGRRIEPYKLNTECKPSTNVPITSDEPPNVAFNAVQGKTKKGRSSKCKSVAITVSIISVLCVIAIVGASIAIVFKQKDDDDILITPTPDTAAVAGPNSTMSTAQMIPTPSEDLWAAWGPWGACDKTCGSGIHTRYRICLQEPCFGNSMQREHCLVKECSLTEKISTTSAKTTSLTTTKVSSTSPTTTASTYRSTATSTSTITESALTQTPTSQSSSTQTTMSQSTSTPTEGQWSLWSSWSGCDKTCGPGSYTRSRTCLLEPCFGLYIQLETCFVAQCPAIADQYGKWTTWAPWDRCSTSCDAGSQSRSRQCQKDDEQNECIGDISQTRECYEGQCPDCSIQCDNGNNNCMKCLCPGRTVSGKVLTDAGVPLQNVEVSFEDFGHTALFITGVNGEFSLDGICSSDKLIFSKEGYTEKEAFLVQSNEIVRLSKRENLYMVKEPISAASLVGGCVHLTCEATGSPEPTYYEWFHDDLLIENVDSQNLTIVNIMSHESGQYKCRASNDYSAIYSRSVTVTVEENESDACDSIPRSQTIQLPLGCQVNGEDKLDIGKCSPMQCALNNVVSCGNTQTVSRCGAVRHTRKFLQCTYYQIPIDIVAECGCLASRNKQFLIGHVQDLDTNSPVYFATVTINGNVNVQADLYGKFVYEISPSQTRITIDITHYSNMYSSSSTVITISETIPEFTMVFYLKQKPEPVAFLSSNGVDMPLISGKQKNPFARIAIPPNSVFDSNGNQYNGEVYSYLDLYDAKDPLSLANAPGDFTTLDAEGEIRLLESSGMFKLDLTDPAGNVLSIGRNITLTHLVNTTDVETVDKIKFWSLHVDGRWEFVGDFRIESTTEARRKRQIDQDTRYLNLVNENIAGVDVSGRWCNFDYISDYICYSKVHLYEDDTLTELYKPNSRVQVITLQGDGADLTTVAGTWAWNGAACIGHPCDTTRNTDNTNYRGYVLAQFGNTFFKAIENPQMFSEFDASVEGDKILTDLSLQKSQTGPFYDYDNRFWYSSSCSNAKISDWSFQFYKESYTQPNTIQYNLNIDITFPPDRLSFYSSELDKREIEVCYMRIRIKTSFQKVVLGAQSYQEHYDSSPDPSLFYGSRQEIIETDGNGNDYYACIEYKPPGTVYLNPMPLEFKDEKTRVVLQMEGDYDFSEVVSNIAGHTFDIDTDKMVADIKLEYADNSKGFKGRFCRNRLTGVGIKDVQKETRDACENVDDLTNTYWAFYFK